MKPLLLVALDLLAFVFIAGLLFAIYLLTP